MVLRRTVREAGAEAGFEAAHEVVRLRGVVLALRKVWSLERKERVMLAASLVAEVGKLMVWMAVG